MDLRCKAKKHAEVIEPGPAVVEISCNSRFCGAGPGVTVLHQFNTHTGELTQTRQFKDPGRKGSNAPGNSPAVRSA